MYFQHAFNMHVRGSYFTYLDEVSFQPCIVVDCLVHRLLSSILHVGLRDVRELGGGVVAPNDHIPHFVRRHTNSCCDLINRTQMLRTSSDKYVRMT